MRKIDRPIISSQRQLHIGIRWTNSFFVSSRRSTDPRPQSKSSGLGSVWPYRMHLLQFLETVTFGASVLCGNRTNGSNRNRRAGRLVRRAACAALSRAAASCAALSCPRLPAAQPARWRFDRRISSRL
ncbi:unnamed protein product [Nesidiocoris tenuis]|uniref:Uncharacterized protein n=1 Tax=Nesidiocoris tenuis TaxID=355587 RepID=A0A6H5GT17_9HEMI|nr:unnamed protein product [Nesidiocoris tenuis]